MKRGRETQSNEAEETLLYKLIKGQERRKRKAIDEEKNEDENAEKKQKMEEEEESEYDEEEEQDEERTEKESKKKVQFRSSWPAFDLFKEVLDADALGELRSGPFKCLFSAFHDEGMDRNHFNKSNKLVEMMADKYNPESEALVIGGKKYRISSTDTAAILRIQKRGRKVALEAVDIDSTKKFFQSGQVMKKTILKAIEKLQTENIEDEEDRRKKRTNLGKLVLLEIYKSFLFPNVGRFISGNLVSSIFGDVSQIPWARNVNNFLSACLKARLQSKA